ncbi:MAG: class I SAM-dependent methyltransferase [Verrucomicrobia bacterium]|nr:class I SAM-dependent methyltransferase [Verrucomicrobiota bacterium]
MESQHWNAIADRFEDEVLNAFEADKDSVIHECIRSLYGKDKSVADLGCGVGNTLAPLAEGFGVVYAVDVSSECLRIAEQRCSELQNVVYIEEDLSKEHVELEECNVVLSLNVAIMPSFNRRQQVLRNTADSVKRGGHLVLLVPSLESALYGWFRLAAWNVDEGLTYSRASEEGRSALSADAQWLADGVIRCGGVLAKHYLKEELAFLLPTIGLTPLGVEKVQYPWSTEFDDPPEDMGGPYPWDWLVLAVKE